VSQKRNRFTINVKLLDIQIDKSSTFFLVLHSAFSEELCTFNLNRKYFLIYCQRFANFYRPKYSSKTEMSAGETPGILEA